MDWFNFAPEVIYSIDETGCATEQKSGRVVGQREVKQVDSSAAAEGGTFCLDIEGINAERNTIPLPFQE